MKKLSLFILTLLTPMLLMAQKVIIKGDMNDDGSITTADVAKVVETALGKEPPVRYIIDPNEADSTSLAGMWRTHEGTQIEFGNDGTINSTEYPEAETYEYFPFQGFVLLYGDNDKTIPLKVLSLIKKTDTYLILCPQGTSNNTLYYSGATFIGGIKLDPNDLNLKVGDKTTISAEVTPTTALNTNLKWESGNPSVATVDQTGNVVAKGKGKCTITVSSTDGTNIMESCNITVIQPVTGISLSANSLKLWPNAAGKLTATVTPQDATNNNVTWKSSNANVASVDTKGIVTAKAIGKCDITCTAADGNGAKAVCTIIVEEKELIRVTEITISDKTITLAPGKSTQLSVTNVLPEDADNKAVKWDSDATDVATVDNNGKITAVGIGTCKIICSALDGSGTTTECEVKVVKNTVTDITLNHTDIELHIEDSLSLKAIIHPIDAEVQDVIWTTTVDTIATVDENGLVKAVSEGTCIITCISVENEEIKATCNVNVTKTKEPILVKEITISQNSISLNLKDKDALKTVSIIPTNAESLDVIWSSDNEKVATVDQNGNITAVAPGTCHIKCTATDNGNAESTCTVTVTPFYKGHELVDLGITDANGKPIFWATCNVGAASPQLYGNYYAWGETSTKSEFSWATYTHCKDGSKTSLTRYCNSSSYGLPDNRLVLEDRDDAATFNWGEGWRMPTDDEFAKLRNECKWRWVSSYNGIQVNGYTVTGKKEGYTDKTIFIPAAGYYEGSDLKSNATLGAYWSSSLYSGGYNYYSYGLSIDNAQWMKTRLNRCNGLTIRPVCQ